MDADTLKTMQAALKQRYRDAPAAAMITLYAQSNGVDGITCKLSIQQKPIITVQTVVD